MFGLSWIRARSACKESIVEVEFVVIYPDVVKAFITMDGFFGERKYEERKECPGQIFRLYHSERIREKRNK